MSGHELPGHRLDRIISRLYSRIVLLAQVVRCHALLRAVSARVPSIFFAKSPLPTSRSDAPTWAISHGSDPDSYVIDVDAWDCVMFSMGYC